MTAYIIVAFIAAAVVAALVYTRKKRADRLFDRLPVKMTRDLPFNASTPKGARVAAYRAIAPEHQAAVFRAIDDGIDVLLAATAYLNWERAKTHPEFYIAFIAPDRTNQDGSPALLVSGYQSAGTVIGLEDGYPYVTIVLPFQADWNYLMYLMHSVWFEGEHYREWLNDRQMFRRFATAGDVHPHHPPALQSKPRSFLGAITSQAPTIFGSRFKCGCGRTQNLEA